MIYAFQFSDLTQSSDLFHFHLKIDLIISKFNILKI